MKKLLLIPVVLIIFLPSETLCQRKRDVEACRGLKEGESCVVKWDHVYQFSRCRRDFTQGNQLAC